MSETKLYRCGWCGHPTDADGNPIEFDRETVEEQYKDAEQLYGLCCPEDIVTPACWRTVTREMAIDSGYMSLEGQRMRW